MFATKWTSLRGFLKCKKRWGRCAAHNNMWGDVIHCSSKKWDWLERFTQERWNWAAAFLHLMNELTRPSSPCSVQCSKNSEGLVHLTKLWNCLWRSWAPAWRIKGTFRKWHNWLLAWDGSHQNPAPAGSLWWAGVQAEPWVCSGEIPLFPWNT